jgi:hypothetical protein
MQSQFSSPNPQTSIVTVFGSSRPTRSDKEYQTAYEVGKLLARAGFIVCNGGYGGTMEASARGAKENGGSTIGVVTKIFGAQANPYIDTTIVMDTLTSRLMKLVELGNGYVVLKGGTGTLLELAAVWEFMNKGILIPKPIVAFERFWSPIVSTMKNQLLEENRVEATNYVTLVSTPKECVDKLLDKLPHNA